jgi:hypothetical protein
MRAGVGSVGTWAPAAGVAAAAMILAAGCSAATNTANAGSTGNGTGSTASPVGGASQTPVVAIQAALTAATTGDDSTFTVNGTFTSPSGSGTLSGQEEFSPSFGLSMTETFDGASISEVWIGNTVYLKVPEFADLLSHDRSWFAVDLSDTGPYGTLFASQISALKGMNPAQLLESLLASGDITDVGQQTINGVPTTHYTGTIDPATVYQGATAKQYLTPAQIQQLEELADIGGSSHEKIDAWIASNGLPVQVAITDTDSSGTSGTQDEFTKWGQPVDITAPPPSDVENLSSMTSGLPTSGLPTGG